MSRARFALEVAAAALLPWRSARTIREQRESITILVRTVADLAPPPERCLYLVK